MLLEDQVGDECGDDYDDEACEEEAEIGLVLRLDRHGREAEGQCLLFRGIHEDEREEVFVPDAEEVEDGGGDEAWACEGEHDLPEHGVFGSAVDDGGLAQGVRQGFEESGENQNRERQAERDVDENKSAEGVVKLDFVAERFGEPAQDVAESGVLEEKRDEDQLRGNHHAGDKEEVDESVAGQVCFGEDIGRHRAEQNNADEGEAGDDHGVDEVLAEVGFDPGVLVVADGGLFRCGLVGKVGVGGTRDEPRCAQRVLEDFL